MRVDEQAEVAGCLGVDVIPFPFRQLAIRNNLAPGSVLSMFIADYCRAL
jgi:hypothetical protein